MDDEEWGAGRRLLDMLSDAEIFYRVVFVVRYYGGENLYNERFTAYVEAAQSAINHHPLNTVLNVSQTPYPVASNSRRDSENAVDTTHVGGKAPAEEEWRKHYKSFFPQEATQDPPVGNEKTQETVD